MLRDRAQNASANSKGNAAAKASSAESRPPVRRISQVDPRTATRNVTRGVFRGSRGFGRGFWKPFTHAVRALWHEITGVFFAIFAIFFGQHMWRLRHSWKSGPEHSHFIIYFVITLVLVYFSISAFVSSRRSPH